MLAHRNSWDAKSGRTDGKQKLKLQSELTKGTAQTMLLVKENKERKRKRKRKKEGKGKEGKGRKSYNPIFTVALWPASKYKYFFYPGKCVWFIQVPPPTECIFPLVLHLCP